jgi:hypothetical protein
VERQSLSFQYDGSVFLVVKQLGDYGAAQMNGAIASTSKGSFLPISGNWKNPALQNWTHSATNGNRLITMTSNGLTSGTHLSVPTTDGVTTVKFKWEASS